MSKCWSTTTADGADGGWKAAVRRRSEFKRPKSCRGTLESTKPCAQESRDQAEALTYFDLGERKKIATLCRENLHAKAEVGGKYFGEKGGREE
jgi:hypothetical protein